jgi:hypothetical protein
MQGCRRCADAVKITMMILHERGLCRGADYCEMCSLYEDA